MSGTLSLKASGRTIHDQYEATASGVLGRDLGGILHAGDRRWTFPGRQEIGLLTTALVGIAASLLGGILGDIFDAGWLIRFLVAVALAALVITLLSRTEGRARA